MNELSEEMEMRTRMVIKSFVLFVVMILLNSCVSNAKRSVLTEMWGMIVDENNLSSIKGIEKAGFVRCGSVYISKFARRYRLVR